MKIKIKFIVQRYYTPRSDQLGKFYGSTIVTSTVDGAQFVCLDPRDEVAGYVRHLTDPGEVYEAESCPLRMPLFKSRSLGFPDFDPEGLRTFIERRRSP